MRKYLNEQDKINSIRLELRHQGKEKKVWVLVEGETDQKLFRKFLDAENVYVEQVQGGVERLRQAVQVLGNESDQVLGIRDADFLRLNGEEENTKNLYWTDQHDAEMMMVSSDETFRSVVSEHCGDRLGDFRELRKEFFDGIKFLAGVRWYNDRENMELNFKGLKIQALVSISESGSISIRKERCVEELNQRSPNKKDAISTSVIEELINEVDDMENLCNGHDVLNVFAFYSNLQNHGDSSRKKKSPGISEKHLSSDLRIAYTIRAFATTDLFKNLKQWEINNSRILFSE